MKRNIVPEDLLQLETLTDGQLNINGDLFVYASSYGSGKKEIRVVDLVSGSEKVLVKGGRCPRLSPDGTLLSCLKAGQLWIYSIDSGQGYRLTSMRNGVLDPLWSPKGDSICFSSPCADDADPMRLQTLPGKAGAYREKESADMDPVVIEDFGYKFDGHGFHRPERKHLWVVKVDGGKAWRITDGEFDHILHNWSPDGSAVIFISSRCREKKDALANDLFSVSPDGGDIRQITSSGWLAAYPTPFRPFFTHGGNYILAGMFEPDDLKKGNGIPFAFLHRIAADGTEDMSIFPEEAPCHECVQFPYNPKLAACMHTAVISSDGNSCLFCSGVDGACNIYSADLCIDATLGKEPRIRNVTQDKWAVTGIDTPRDGKVAVSLSAMDKPGDYWLVNEKDGTMIRQLTRCNSWLNGRDISRPEELWIDCLDGGGKVHGWVLPPQNREPGKKYPAILYIHGGPHPFYTYSLDFEHQMLAGAGFTVICCNPRGSSSYGREHEDMGKAFDGSAYTDLLQFVDEACRKYNFIDGDRIGATGGSYGGYMVNHMAVHCSRFRAYITQRSIANSQISYASADLQGDSSKYKNFEEFMVHNLENSAVSYAENLNAPILIMHGIDDLRCPVEQAHQLFTAFRDIHPEIPVKMILYPECAHDQPRDPGNLLHYYHAMIDWFTTHLMEEN